MRRLVGIALYKLALHINPEIQAALNQTMQAVATASTQHGILLGQQALLEHQHNTAQHASLQ